MSEYEPNKMQSEDTFEPKADAPNASTAADISDTADAEALAADAKVIEETPWGASDAAEAEVAEDDPAARISALEGQVEELNDKLLRALAEAENVRRRAQRDKEDTAKYGIKNFAEGVLGVADNLGRAMASIDADARVKDPNLENLFVGVEMVQKDLMSTFERFGVTPIKALGAKFDPMLHEAMYEVEDADTPAGTIAQVLEPGYVLHGRTLRAAKVGITKGGLKEAQMPAADAPAEASSAEEVSADPPTREGQAAYETKTESKAPSGGNLDQEL